MSKMKFSTMPSQATIHTAHQFYLCPWHLFPHRLSATWGQNCVLITSVHSSAWEQKFQKGMWQTGKIWQLLQQFFIEVMVTLIVDMLAVLTRFSRGSSWPRDWTPISCISGKFFPTELPGKPAHDSKVMHNILHARLQHYVSQELSDVQARFIKGRGIRDPIASTCWIIEKARKFQKKCLLLFHWLR